MWRKNKIVNSTGQLSVSILENCDLLTHSLNFLVQGIAEQSSAIQKCSLDFRPLQNFLYYRLIFIFFYKNKEVCHLKGGFILHHKGAKRRPAGLGYSISVIHNTIETRQTSTQIIFETVPQFLLSSQFLYPSNELRKAAATEVGRPSLQTSHLQTVEPLLVLMFW